MADTVQRSSALHAFKRSLISPEDESEPKKRRYFYRLESESSKASEEDTESISSLQDRETDVVRDTSDTDTKSECSSDDSHILEVEYEVASISDDDHPFEGDCTSSGTEDVLATAGAIAAAIYDTSVEAWLTDVEDSDNSSLEENSFGRTEYWTCIQCKSENNNPCFRYCEKCFQSCRQCKMRKTLKCFPLCNSCYKERKNFFPPRPRKNKKSKKDLPETAVKLDTLRSCLNGLASQDSGIGSSQEFPALDLGQIVVPKHLSASSSSITSSSATNNSSEPDFNKTLKLSETNRKRQCSESSLSDFEEVKRIKTTHTKISSKEEMTVVTDKSSNKTETVPSNDKKDETVVNISSLAEYKELCIICNSSPKNSIFLHGSIAHMCSCYKCAMRTWLANKRCPVCNRKVKNVVKVFTI